MPPRRAPHPEERAKLASRRTHGLHAADTLILIRDFAAAIPHGSWFAACGESLTESERDEARAYLAALGFTGMAIAGAATWPEAAIITQRPDWSRAWWEAEAEAQAALQQQASLRFGSAALLDALTAVAEAADALHGAAALAASRAGIADPALSRVAAGAAAQACHQAALALAADVGPAHLFAIKYRLFAAGRWPLGIVGGTFFVF